MERPKLRIVYFENGGIKSYVHLEKSEGLRVIKILKLIPELTAWTPAGTISKMIKENLAATLWTLQKLAGAKKIDLKNKGTTETIAERPVLLLKKDQYNTNNNLKKTKYLRPTIYVKAHIRK